MINNIPPPKYVTLIPSFKCTAACPSCCFQCSPKNSEKLTNEEMYSYIDEILETYPSIECIIISGGECFLLEDDLYKLIEYISLHNILTRVISNGYWAKTPTITLSIIKKLRAAGLNEINFSVGQEHQTFVPINSVINAAVTAAQEGFSNVILSIEGNKNKSFAEKIINNHRIVSHNKKSPYKIEFIHGKWQNFNKDLEIYSNHEYRTEDKILILNNNKGCEYILNSILINPNSEILSCCGLSVKRIKYFNIGNIKEQSIKSLYELQFRDIIKIWINLDGPLQILNYLDNTTYKEDEHMCFYCSKLLTSPIYIKKLQALEKLKIIDIITRYGIKKEKKEYYLK